ncbi:hypothetical protein BpHYR1_049696 [Brachionus plicatilis]|uniref:Uncharacterized protein n=1 Tax=Brachionus plicatilis TaxID=10195 RepID=A0A3M7QV66_BRAPC|nr:hypothetical protein BpHYR1_049696 [Brachionus plicatilis]
MLKLQENLFALDNPRNKRVDKTLIQTNLIRLLTYLEHLNKKKSTAVNNQVVEKLGMFRTKHSFSFVEA